MPTFNKWNNLQPVTKATEFNRKWDSLQPARAINKLNAKFRLPAFEIGPTHIGPVSYINHQFNYTLPEDFTILNWQNIVNQLPTTRGDFDENFLVCVRYRTGGDNIVRRYRLNSIPNTPISEPFYDGQLIKANFVLEIFTLKNRDWGADTAMVNPSDLLFETSISYDPETPEEEPIIYDPVEEAEGFVDLDLGDLFIELPSPLPMTFNEKGPFILNDPVV